MLNLSYERGWILWKYHNME